MGGSMNDRVVADGGSTDADPGDESTGSGAARRSTGGETDGGSVTRHADASDRDSGAVTRDGDGGTSGVFAPAYGPVEAVVGYVLFYLVVDRATPVLVDELARPFPEMVPEPVTTYAAASLWLVLGIVLLATARDQLANDSPKFADDAEREAFLDEYRPALWKYRIYGALIVVGGAVTVLTWDAFLSVLVEFLSVVVVEVDGATPVLPGAEDVAVFVVFFVGFAAFSRGMDRLLIGGARELLYRRYRE